MMKAIEVTYFFLTLILCGVSLDSRSTCSEDRECSNSAETCCGGTCVDGSKVCKIECRKQADCDSLSNQNCVDGFCECLPPSSSCSNTSILPCRVDYDCLENAKCRNRTCAVTKDERPDLPLNPALLAIVTIISVLMFSCLFCCCLSQMKSERNSMKTRVAKGKLKKVRQSCAEDEDAATNGASFPLLNVESQVSSTAAEKNTMTLDKDEEALISAVLGGPALPPIREEDEGDTDKV